MSVPFIYYSQLASDGETDIELIKEFNTVTSKRILRECFCLPEILFPYLQQNIFEAYYNNRIHSIVFVICRNRSSYSL